MHISEIEKLAQPGPFSTEDITVLASEVGKLTAGATYLEVGVHKGRSLSVANMVGTPNRVFIHGVDVMKQPELAEYLEKNTNIHFYWADSVLIASLWKHISPGLINLIFIDGDHSYEGCRRDIEAWYPHMDVQSIMLFHDYDETSPGVMQAVDEFAKRLNLTVEVCKKEGFATSIAKIQL